MLQNRPQNFEQDAEIGGEKCCRRNGVSLTQSKPVRECDELAPLHGLPQAEEMTAYHIEWSRCAVQ
jgi:hypothetical protein